MRHEGEITAKYIKQYMLDVAKAGYVPLAEMQKVDEIHCKWLRKRSFRMPACNYDFSTFRESVRFHIINHHANVFGKLPKNRDTDNARDIHRWTCDIGKLWSMEFWPMLSADNAFCNRIASEDLPEDFRFSEIRWGYPGFTVGLPKGYARSPFEDGAYIAYVMVDVADQAFRHLYGTNAHSPLLRFVFISNTGQSTVLIRDSANYNSKLTIQEIITDWSDPDDTENIEARCAFSRSMLEFVFGLTLHWMAMPEGHTPAHNEGERADGSINGMLEYTEIWTPNILGKSVQIPQNLGSHKSIAAELEFPGTSPRTHWRQGHYRRRNGRSVWIHTLKVNAHKEHLLGKGPEVLGYD